MSSPALALIPVLAASTGTGATIGPAQPAGHRNHAVRETRMETRRAGNRGASQATPGLGAPLLPLFFHPASRPRLAEGRP
jgi:hypothetical protein